MKEKAYRIGYVTKQGLSCYACCRMIPQETVLFEYIEVEYEDGTHKFFFEDEEGRAHFERNFHSNRFMSFHEFFTSEEMDVEERGSLKLKYFVRLGDKFYEKVNLSDKKAELEEMVSRGEVVKVNDRCTEYGKYDRTVNNHWNE